MLSILCSERVSLLMLIKFPFTLDINHVDKKKMPSIIYRDGT